MNPKNISEDKGMIDIPKFELFPVQIKAFNSGKNNLFFFTKCKNEMSAKTYGTTSDYKQFDSMIQSMEDKPDNISELIKSNLPRCEYYDIDYNNTDKTPEQVFLNFNHIYNAYHISHDLPIEVDWRITDASKKSTRKVSLHLVNRCKIQKNHKETLDTYTRFNEFIQTHYPDERDVFDMACKGGNRVMRMIGQSKFGEDRPLEKAWWHAESKDAPTDEFYIQNVNYQLLIKQQADLKTRNKQKSDENKIKKKLEKSRITEERTGTCMTILDKSDDETESLCTLIADLVSNKKSALCNTTFPDKIGYETLRDISFAYIESCRENKRDDSDIYSFWETDLYPLYRHSGNHKGTILWKCFINANKPLKSYTKASLHYWARSHCDYQNIFCLNKDSYHIGTFNAKDDYYAGDFYRELFSTTWDSYQEMLKFFLGNFNRICIPLASGNIEYYFKKEINPYEHCKTLGSTKVYYMIDGEKKSCQARFLPESVINLITTYNGIGFEPYDTLINLHEPIANIFNTYHGFKADYMLGEFNKEDIQPVLDHIFIVWANRDQVKYDHIISWLSHIIKYPNRQTKVMIVLFSNSEQTGKGIIAEWLVNEIFGREISGKTQSVEAITGRFNSFLDRKLLVVLDDTSSHDTYKSGANNKLKSIITDPTQVIENKGIDSKNQTNYVNLMMLTNQGNAQKIGKGDSRIAVYECNDEKRGKRDYFNKLGSLLSLKETADNFYTYLYNMTDLVDPRNIPQTKEREDMMINTLDQPTKFLMDIKDEEVEGLAVTHKFVPKINLYSEFTNWVISNGERQGIYSFRKFNSAIKFYLKEDNKYMDNKGEICTKSLGKKTRCWNMNTLLI